VPRPPTPFADPWLEAHAAGADDLQDALADHFGEVEDSVQKRLLQGTPPREAFQPKEWTKPLKEALHPVLHGLASTAAKGEDDTAELPAKAGKLVDAAIARHLDQPYWNDIHDGITDDIDAAVKAYHDEEAKAFTVEKGPFGAVARLARFVIAWLRRANDDRIDRIATTEATAALNSGKQAAAQATGLTGRKRWVAVRDEVTRDTHAAAHGQEVPIDGQFTVGTEQCDHPGDPTLSPGERINCRCECQYVVD
jgi:hypothetical protein